MYNAMIGFKDVGGIKTRTVIKDIPDGFSPTIAKVLALATALKANVLPGVESYALLKWTEAEVSDPLTAAVGSNCDKGLINFSYVDAGGVTQYGQMWLPNPDMSHFEFVQGVGYRLLAASKTLLETSMSTATGLTIKITEGKIEYREREAGIGAKSDSCLAFTDAVGNVAFMSFPLATTSAALATFGGALNTDAFTQSILDRSYFLDKTEVLTDPTVEPGIAAAGDWDCVEKRAVVKMVYIDGGKKKFISLTVPGIKKSVCEQKAGQKGWKLTKATGDGIALMLSGLYGTGNRTVRYVGSRIDGVDLQAQ